MCYGLSNLTYTLLLYAHRFTGKVAVYGNSYVGVRGAIG
jgi:hypothetical protein